jgi:hypothetical protein
MPGALGKKKGRINFDPAFFLKTYFILDMSDTGSVSMFEQGQAFQ